MAYDELRPDYFGERSTASAGVTPLREALVGGVRPTFLLLFSAVGAVLLVAAVNVANLLLARLTARRGELALKSALGATRGRLAVQVLTESALLALLGGGLGLFVAAWTLSALVAHLPASMPRTSAITIDTPVLAFTFVLSLAAGCAAALLPALGAARTDLRTVLASGTHGGGAPRHRVHHALVAVEIALAAVLVLGAGLLVKSFQKLRQVDVGFATERVLSARLRPPSAAYPDEATRRVYFERLVEGVRAVPGIESAAVINRLPMTSGDVGMSFHLEDGTAPEDFRTVSVRLASPEFLETLGIPLLGGRPLTAGDRFDAPPVGLVNQAMARRLWGDGNPVGRRLVFDTGELWFTVVGVVGDIRQHRLDQATRPQVYRPLAQTAWEPSMALVVRTAAEAGAVVAGLEAAIWSVDPNVPLTGVSTMDQVIRRSLRDSRLLTALFGLFAALALGLGAVGVYGVTSYAVSQRTRENAVRLALGATAGSVVSATLRRALFPVGLGLAAAGVGSLGLLRLLERFLFEVEPHDPAVFAAVALIFLASGVLAGWGPARRATRVDPVVVLRDE